MMFKLRSPILKFTKFFFQRARPYLKFYNFCTMVEPGKRTKETTAGSVQLPTGVKIGGPFKLAPEPAFLSERAKLFDDIYQKQKQLLESRPKREIDITFPDGKVIKGKSWETTGLEIAKKISKKLAEAAVAVKVTYSKKDEDVFSSKVCDVEDESDEIKVDHGELYDLNRPLEGDCTVEIIKFDDPLGKTVFWHSSAHILGGALEQEFGGHLCIGPPLENGFYYDVYIGENRLHPEQFEKIEKRIKKFVEENHSFQKIYLTKQEALELFKDNPFKTQLITYKIPENAITTAYRSGTLIDLCTGPHLPSTGRAKAFKVTKASAAYWLGKNTNDDLQRVYGISFPTEKELKEYIELQNEIEKRDHRNIGLNQELFFFSTMSPGSAFFYPTGAVIYNRLIDLIRKEYKVRGYQEVITPNMYNTHLWETSGHWAKYRTNMFTFKVEEQDFALKPMNCPGHCLMFDSILRSYKELPIRFADFGVLHRNELSGALSGLTRVRRFQQDDAHIFCTIEQIQDEILGVLDFLQYIYGILGFEFKYDLSTRPAEALGGKELWDKAESALAEALNKSGKPWKENPGDGAFYGPKIDIKVCDALKREHQLGTIQLDFNLPIRFNLQYRSAETDVFEDRDTETEESKSDIKSKSDKREKGEKKEKKPKKTESEKEGKEGKEVQPETTAEPKAEPKVEEKHEHEHTHEHTHAEESKSQASPGRKITDESMLSRISDEAHHLKTGFQRPVMIHRAVLGSVERMLAILCEHTGGKWPFWLSPRQVKVIAISDKYMEYAEAVYQRLKIEGYAADIERSHYTINKKVRNAQLEQFNFVAVVGDEEMKTGTVDLRERDNKDRLGKFTVPGLLKHFESLKVPPSEAELKLKAKAFFAKQAQDELDHLNNELLLKVFLDGTTQPGNKDLELFEKLKNTEVDSARHPNLFRWKNFVATYLESKK